MLYMMEGGRRQQAKIIPVIRLAVYDNFIAAYEVGLGSKREKEEGHRGSQS